MNTITKTVRYAHPDSPMAAELGCPDGCYYVRIDDDEKGTTVSQPFATVKEAEDHAEALLAPWCRWYVCQPLEGSRFYRHVARWADTHEARVAQWRALVAKREARKRPTLAALRKGWFGSQAPRYVAEFDDGTVGRASFWQAKGRSFDFARGRKVAIGSSGKTIVRGYVEHDVPGEPWVRVEDPMTATTHTVKRPSYKAALAALVAALERERVGDSAELANAFQTAVHALGERVAA